MSVFGTPARESNECISREYKIREMPNAGSSLYHPSLLRSTMEQHENAQSVHSFAASKATRSVRSIAFRERRTTASIR